MNNKFQCSPSQTDVEALLLTLTNRPPADCQILPLIFILQDIEQELSMETINATNSFLITVYQSRRSETCT